MARYVVTSKEANVINAVDGKLGATVTELSGSTRSAPGEVREVLRRLVDRGLIESTEDDNILFLTSKGHRLHGALAGTAAADVFVADDDSELTGVNSEDLDAAIDEAISAKSVDAEVGEAVSEVH